MALGPGASFHSVYMARVFQPVVVGTVAGDPLFVAPGLSIGSQPHLAGLSLVLQKSSTFDSYDALHLFDPCLVILCSFAEGADSSLVHGVADEVPTRRRAVCGEIFQGLVDGFDKAFTLPLALRSWPCQCGAGPWAWSGESVLGKDAPY